MNKIVIPNVDADYGYIHNFPFVMLYSSDPLKGKSFDGGGEFYSDVAVRTWLNDLPPLTTQLAYLFSSYSFIYHT